jgi:hypothetical protein
MFAFAATAASATTTTSTATTASAGTTANGRCTRVTAATDRYTGMTATTDRCTGVAATYARRTGVTAANTASVSAPPAVPAVTAAPADARSKVLAAPVPAGSVPTVVVPAIIVAKPDELHPIETLQAVDRTTNCSGGNHRGRVETGTHYRCPGKENSCSRDRDRKSTHDDLARFDQIASATMSCLNTIRQRT